MLRVAFWIGLVGFALSLAVHLATFTNLGVPDAAVALHLGVFVAFVPVVFALKNWVEARGGDFSEWRSQWAAFKAVFAGIPRWQALGLVGLFVYTLVNFNLEFARLVSGRDAGFSYRLFSGHWMVFYAISAVLARRFLAATRDEVASRKV